ncbi:MAG: hypothetical protein JWR24_2900 [Actinoallomurus sp.]|nr:hypothetical protein [Actinoallomurus sp.]
MLSDNEGLAATTFSEYIKGLIDRKNGVMTLALQACEHNRYACINQAQAIRQLKRSYEELAVQLVFAFVIGQVVSFFTAESTQAMSDAIDAGLIARITALLEEFVTAGAELTGAMESTVKTLSSILTKAAVGGPKGVLAAGATAPFTSAIAAAFGDKPTDGATALKQLLWGGGLGALGGLVGGSAAEMSTALENASAEGGPSSTQLRIIAKGLADGSVTVAAANDSLGQLIQNGEVNPANLAAAAIGAKLEGAINAKKGDEGD